jgi:two-component system, LuxR family, sensor kinase FixL
MRQRGARMYAAFFRGSKGAILFRAAILMAAIGLLDWRIVGEIPLRFLYLVPMLVAGSVLEPWWIDAVRVLRTLLAESFDDPAWNPRTGISRDLLYFIAFFGAGLFMQEAHRNRRVALRPVEEIERQSEARREGEIRDHSMREGACVVVNLKAMVASAQAAHA